MASSTFSHSRRFDVFPSFSGEDVRKSFLSHLLKELDRKSVNTFIDHGIERSRPIGPELISAIRESRISIVVFSKNYASSKWCLNELLEIHKSFKELNQMVIPIFYKVDPSHVRKQTGHFGKVFEETCKGKTEDEKQRWIQALADVANMAGEDLRNWCNEANMIDKIADDISNKLITTSNCFGDFVGIEAHIEAMSSMLCLESEEARMVGIVGPSGIGKSTIARALCSQLSRQFHYRAFVAYKRTNHDDYGMKLCWEEQFLSEILGQKDLKLYQLGAVEERLKHKKVLIFLDDVDDIELLQTLVGQTKWFGPGSRIIVITQDRQLLKAHEIDLIYEVRFPSEDVALKMLCRSAFRQNSPPDGLRELAVEVAMLAGNLPLGLSVLGSSLRRKDKKEWMEMLPRLQNGLDGKIEKILRVGYDRLDGKDQELFLFIAFACLLNGLRGGYFKRSEKLISVPDIKDFLGESANTGLKMLADKSLIRITPHETIEMHNLLQKLAREISRAESINNPGKRRFLVDVEDIRDVFTDKTGTETVLGIYFNALEIKEPFSIDEKSFEGMRNLQALVVRGSFGPCVQTGGNSLHLPQGLDYLPRKLRLLHWDEYPSKCLPSNFKAEGLVELTMQNSLLEKLWEGTLPLGNLKKMRMSYSIYLKELPDLSNAINLEEVYLDGCASLVTFPSSIQNLLKLRVLDFEKCTKLESFPTQVNLESLEYFSLRGCSRLRNFPQIHMYSTWPGIGIAVEDCFWNKNLREPDYLGCLMRCMPCKVRPEHLKTLIVRGNMLEKLWEGVQSLGSLVTMDLSECENLTEIPDLSKANNLRFLSLNNCKSLVRVPCTIGNLNKLVKLMMKGCTMLEVFPTDVNLSSLRTLDLSGCSRLRIFPQISQRVKFLYLDKTGIEQVPCCIENFSRLSVLLMRGCERLKNVSPNIFSLTSLEKVDFSDCGEFTALSDDIVVAREYQFPHTPSDTEKNEISNSGRRESKLFDFINCFSLNEDARELIQRSYLRPTVLPGGEVSTYFTHRASGNSLTFTFPRTTFSQVLFEFKACLVVEPLSNRKVLDKHVRVRWHFRGLDYEDKILACELESCKADHLVLGSFQFRPIGHVSKLEYLEVIKFEFFFNHHSIKGCGVVLSDVFSAPAGGESEYHHGSGVIWDERSNKRMRMASRKSEDFAVWPNYTVYGNDGSKLERDEEKSEVQRAGNPFKRPFLESVGKTCRRLSREASVSHRLFTVRGFKKYQKESRVCEVGLLLNV